MKRTSKQPATYSNKHRFSRTLTIIGLTSALLGTSIITSPSSLLPASYAEAASSSQAEHAQKSYNLFIQRLQKPATLGWARATLVNRIDEFTPTQATLAVLQLENAYNNYWTTAMDQMIKPNLQQAIGQIYKPGMTMLTASGQVKKPKYQMVLQDLAHMGYKLEATEGTYYPVVDYKSFQVFNHYIQPDIRDYINIMAAETEQPTSEDAGIVIGWDELLKRTLAMETFLNTYSSSNRRTPVQELYDREKMYVFHGTDNTPLFEYGTLTIDPEAKKAYQIVLDSKTNTQIQNSQVLTYLQKYLQLIEQSSGKKSTEIVQFLKQYSL
ncbi:hypothetical protein [Paenibacillus bovis]|uniref:Uncharacterized protein n=1 Tax=Paenibacillus bovis TaxID=1616788 RepID=A0A172ZGS8_9BACL|nr:hypothetical protein [Paenibacillus bovis]ANF96330.1 hypothetical protein AR543_10170 [Paenibacillus bovis]